MGGWSALKAMRKAKAYVKGDERILGDSDFVDRVLEQSMEAHERRYRLESQGMNVDNVAERVAQLLGMTVDEVWSQGKHRRVVAARSLLCFWAVRELGITMASLARRLDMSSTAISKSVSRGAQLVEYKKYELMG